ncbi:cytochrome bd ubiquinol oxidase subunit II [Gemmatirosa kalamazoonensis]|uniref:Cytochrome bd ubiquinol oxidase subunit II n=1 Tax=Gemmatirosa kalamazoonensis TaxID=861299 RepID=W0RAG8_9BACT|nr:cytochrome d ubiquinol oxidase subunit II [Gemmatirosa kalamazoonensis]AHG88104.1 cytochrome bd ubiquinol oxidase subunit II [Gemmatirosa kalamazoonensis]
MTALTLGGVPIGLPEIAAGVMALALNAYALLGGADFGGGVWDLLARGPRRAAQRALIAETIAPIWEANHVWLILVVVLCFTCFPPAFAQLATVLHVPLTLMLVGIVLRGSAFVFRAYDVQSDDVKQRRWGLPFAVASLVTPVLLGVTLGALASGAVGAVDPTRGTFAERFVAPWATPFSLAIGALTLALFALLAATYLTVEADDPALADDFRRRALAAQAATVLAAAVAPLLAPAESPMRGVAAEGALARLIAVAAAVCAAAVCVALWRRRWLLARLAAQGEAACLVWGWAWAQFPAVIPPNGTAARLAAPPATLAWALGALAVGTAILLPSFVYLFRVFDRHRQGAG